MMRKRSTKKRKSSLPPSPLPLANPPLLFERLTPAELDKLTRATNEAIDYGLEIFSDPQSRRPRKTIASRP